MLLAAIKRILPWMPPTKVVIGGLAVVSFWRSPHGPLGSARTSGPPRAGYSQRRKREKRGRKGRFNMFATAGLCGVLSHVKVMFTFWYAA